jgi:hypothetical protein
MVVVSSILHVSHILCATVSTSRADALQNSCSRARIPSFTLGFRFHLEGTGHKVRLANRVLQGLSQSGGVYQGAIYRHVNASPWCQLPFGVSSRPRPSYTLVLVDAGFGNAAPATQYLGSIKQ